MRKARKAYLNEKYIIGQYLEEDTVVLG